MPSTWNVVVEPVGDGRYAVMLFEPRRLEPMGPDAGESDAGYDREKLRDLLKTRYGLSDIAIRVAVETADKKWAARAATVSQTAPT